MSARKIKAPKKGAGEVQMAGSHKRSHGKTKGKCKAAKY